MLAADTIVEVDGEILGKPADDDDARRMLRCCRRAPTGSTPGVAVRGDAGDRREVVTTSVTMVSDVTTPPSTWYVATGEPIDKAGGYAIQGAGGAFVADASTAA